MATLTVGSNQQFNTIAAAVAASKDGDVIAVEAGTYTNDFATATTKITIEGVGGMVNLVATTAPPNGKAILVTTTDVTLDHLSFSGAAVADGNGAGIRYEGGNLVVNACLFTNNQDGLLASDASTGSITINHSEFAYNGVGDGRTHNIYVGQVGTLTITNSYIHDVVVGHEIKSRALKTVIENNRIVDGPTGTASYSIDLPNGGNASISGNIIEQGPQSQNPAIIHFGGEGTPYASSSLGISGNTILNDLSSPSATAVLNQTGVTATLTNNKVFGLTAKTLTSGPATASGTTFLTTEPGYSTAHPYIQAMPDTLVLHLSDKGGPMSFIATIDGKTLGAAQAVTVAHVGTNTEAFTFTGNFGAGMHRLGIEAVAGGKAAGSVFVGSVTYDGVSYSGGSMGLAAGHTWSLTINH